MCVYLSNTKLPEYFLLVFFFVAACFLVGAIQLHLSPRLKRVSPFSPAVGKFPVPVSIIKAFCIARRIRWQKMTRWDWVSQCLGFPAQCDAR